MKTTTKVTGRAVSIPLGVVWGTMSAVMVTLLGVGITSKLVEKEWLLWEHIGYAVLIILILASWAGAIIACNKVKRRRITVCTLTGVLYFAVLMTATALFYGGQYSGVGETALLILCGSLMGIFLGNPEKKGRKRGYLRRGHR